jgi:hypothetical protein
LDNPVLTTDDITDATAIYVADPFMINWSGKWHIFFEILNAATGRGQIGLATSDDARKWDYQQTVLAEPFHMAYPHVFAWQGRHYMVPETYWTSTVRLYVADEFPRRWRFLRNLIDDGRSYSDASIFHKDGRFWMFALRGGSDLALFFCDDFMGRWTEHPRSPLISGNPHITRPGGKMLVLDDNVIRFTQDCYPTYGNKVRAFAITHLSTTNYQEHAISESAVLEASGSGWNRDGMHHIDAHEIGPNQWIACVDGLRQEGWFGQMRHAARVTKALLRSYRRSEYRSAGNAGVPCCDGSIIACEQAVLPAEKPSMAIDYCTENGDLS